VLLLKGPGDKSQTMHLKHTATRVSSYQPMDMTNLRPLGAANGRPDYGRAHYNKVLSSQWIQ